MNHFHNTAATAKLVGISTRHLARVAEAAGIEPLNFGQDGSKNFKYTNAMVEDLKRYMRERPAMAAARVGRPGGPAKTAMRRKDVFLSTNARKIRYDSD